MLQVKVEQGEGGQSPQKPDDLAESEEIIRRADAQVTLRWGKSVDKCVDSVSMKGRKSGNTSYTTELVFSMGSLTL